MQVHAKFHPKMFFFSTVFEEKPFQNGHRRNLSSVSAFEYSHNTNNSFKGFKRSSSHTFTTSHNDTKKTEETAKDANKPPETKTHALVAEHDIHLTEK